MLQVLVVHLVYSIMQVVIHHNLNGIVLGIGQTQSQYVNDYGKLTLDFQHLIQLGGAVG